MNQKLTATYEIFIQASTASVWQALTDPAIIRQYFFGTEAVSDWEVGSALLFKGVWDGREYLDKGTILQSDPLQVFRYNYFSSFSGKEDLPENYAEITYRLQEEGTGTRLLISQDGMDTEEQKAHSEQNWAMVMEGMKKLLEA